MKTALSTRPDTAFSRVDLLCTLMAFTALAAVTWPAIAAPQMRSEAVECQNNLRVIGQAYHSLRADIYDWRPTRDHNGPLSLTDSFKGLSSVLSSTRFFVCPADKFREPANSFDRITVQHLSYFRGCFDNLDQPRDWLAGDRNISGETNSCRTLMAKRIDSESRWSEITHRGAGNVLFMDGSIALISNNEIPFYLNETNVIYIRHAFSF